MFLAWLYHVIPNKKTRNFTMMKLNIVQTNSSGFTVAIAINNPINRGRIVPPRCARPGSKSEMVQRHPDGRAQGVWNWQFGAMFQPGYIHVARPHMMSSIAMGLPTKWMVQNGTSYKNGWFRGTPILGNNHLFMSCWTPLLRANSGQAPIDMFDSWDGSCLWSTWSA